MGEIHQKVKEYIEENSLQQLVRRTCLDKHTIEKFQKDRQRFRIPTLDVVYNFFGLNRDDFYKKNLKRGLKPSKGIIGDLLRVKRLEQGLGLKEVAQKIKGNKRHLIKIERGNSVPSKNSFYMNQLLELYDFTEEERNQIKYCAALQKDMVKIIYKYDKDIGYYGFDK